MNRPEASPHLAGIVHEINSPLGALKSSADTLTRLAKRNANDDTRAERVAAVVRESLERISSVVERLDRLAFLEHAPTELAAMTTPETHAFVEREGRVRMHLGLSEVRRSVESLGGTLELASRANDESAVIIELPWAS